MWIIVPFVAFIIFVIVFGVVLHRKRNRRVREFITERGGTFKGYESLPRKWSRGKGADQRFAVQYETKPAFLHYLIGEHSRGNINVLEELTLNQWLSLEDQDGRSLKLLDMNISRVIFDHRGKRYMHLFIMEMMQTDQPQRTIHADRMPGTDPDKPSALSFEGMIQGFRLMGEIDDDTDAGTLELMISNEAIDLDWRCDSSSPPRWLELNLRSKDATPN